MSENDKNKKDVSHHILPTSSNLVGLCFLIISFIRLFNLGHQTIIDELLAIAIIFFLLASFFSYASIRARSRNIFYEKVADIIFMSGLTVITLIAIVVTLEMIR
jgi:hypothetical protein